MNIDIPPNLFSFIFLQYNFNNHNKKKQDCKIKKIGTQHARRKGSHVSLHIYLCMSCHLFSVIKFQTLSTTLYIFPLYISPQKKKTNSIFQSIQSQLLFVI
eukprot:475183_1